MLCGKQLHFVPESNQHTCPVMRTTTCLHGHKGRRLLAEELSDLRSSDLTTPNLTRL